MSDYAGRLKFKRAYSDREEGASSGTTLHGGSHSRHQGGEDTDEEKSDSRAEHIWSSRKQLYAKNVGT